MGVAPELALAGGGALTGNNTMTAMGAVAAMERVGMIEDETDRIRAAQVRGNVPPPPGYPGGAPLGGFQQPAPYPPQPVNYPQQQY